MERDPNSYLGQLRSPSNPFEAIERKQEIQYCPCPKRTQIPEEMIRKGRMVYCSEGCRTFEIKNRKREPRTPLQLEFRSKKRAKKKKNRGRENRRNALTRYARNNGLSFEDLRMERAKKMALERKFGRSFYTSERWLRKRESTLRKYGEKCMKCGAKKSATVSIHVDHIKPISKYPQLRLNPENLQVLCKTCNHEKSNIDETDWRPESILKKKVQAESMKRVIVRKKVQL